MGQRLNDNKPEYATATTAYCDNCDNEVRVKDLKRTKDGQWLCVSCSKLEDKSNDS